MTITMILATAYLLGSIPAAYIVAFIWTGGRDIHHIGDGNPGVMNVWDNLGFTPALITAAGDIGKGTAAVGLAYWVSDSHTLAIFAGLTAVVGHDYSVFLRFKGGNGTAGRRFKLIEHVCFKEASGREAAHVQHGRCRWRAVKHNIVVKPCCIGIPATGR